MLRSVQQPATNPELSVQQDKLLPAVTQTAHVPFAPERPQPSVKKKAPPRPLTPKPVLLQPALKIVAEYLPLNRANVPDAIKALIGKGKALDRSQMQIIKKINLYIDAANAALKEVYPDAAEYAKRQKVKLVEAGHCHGFNLYRGYLQDHGALKDYNDMVDMIMNCPADKLLQAGHVFEIFHANILRGQKPRVYLDAKYDQQNIDEILGAHTSYHDAKGEDFTKATLKAKLIKLLTPHSRAILVSKVTCVGVLVAHSVSLSTDGKKGVDYFDPNFKSGAGVRIESYEQLMRQVWSSCFSAFSIAERDELNLRISVLHIGNECQPAGGPTPKVLSAAAHTLLWTPASAQQGVADKMSVVSLKLG